jgi:hypothetical protein
MLMPEVHAMSRGALDLSINIMVTLIIALVVIGMGVAFVWGVFSRADELTARIDVTVSGRVPTAAEPLTLTPFEPSLKSGGSMELEVGVYNKEPQDKTFTVRVTECSQGITPKLVSLSSNIPRGETRSFITILTARESVTGEKLPEGKFVCKLQGAEVNENGEDVPEGAVYEAQFTLGVLG